jgi:hypothetical protein
LPTDPLLVQAELAAPDASCTAEFRSREEAYLAQVIPLRKPSFRALPLSLHLRQYHF